MQIEAMTLHRLLKLYPGRSRLFDPKKIDADLIVVDEASMIDASLFAHLLASVPSGTRFYFSAMRISFPLSMAAGFLPISYRSTASI